MNDENINNAYSNFVITLMLLFPVVINSVKIIGNLILLILVFMGIYILFKEKKIPFMIPDLKLFSWLAFSYFIVMLLSIVQNEGFINEIHHLGRKAHFALAPLIALAIYRVKLPIDKILLSIKIGLIIIGIIVIYQYTAGHVRPSGMYNANIFGDLVLIMVFFSIVNFFEENKFNLLLTVISSSLGVYAVVLSGNRGTLIMLIIMSIVYLLIIFNKYFKGKTKEKILISLACIFIIFTLFQSDKVSKGFNRAEQSILSWVNKGPSTSSAFLGSDEIREYRGTLKKPGINRHEWFVSSAALRLEMWKGSIEAVIKSPWTGHGYRNANNVVSNYVDPEIKETISAFTHLHNEYITNLVSAGIIGLISLLTLLIFPLIVFLKNFAKNDKSTHSIMGILLCTSYAGIGMTHIILGEEHVNAFYIFFLAILLPKVVQESRSPSST